MHLQETAGDKNRIEYRQLILFSVMVVSAPVVHSGVCSQKDMRHSGGGGHCAPTALNGFGRGVTGL